MEECSYLPDFYIPSIDRWFEIKGQPLTVSEVQKCEQFCRRKDNENIKFSILIGAPKPLMLEEEDFSILGIREYTWQWPSQMYPSDTLLLAQGLTREEYYSRFLPAIWKVDGVDDKLLIRAIREARSARFEFGETPKGDRHFPWHFHRNWGGEYENVAVLVAIAVNEDGFREV